MEIFEGSLEGSALKIAVIQSCFNRMITDALKDGCIAGLCQHGVSRDDISLFLVPGALEIPLILQEIGRSDRFDGAVCVGAVIRGDTAHFDVVVNQSASGIQQVTLDLGFPAANGVLTTDSMEQALDRAGGKSGNKGLDAAIALISTVQLLRSIA
ncbi:6,7-dimethyl-8-ribityllumazine synthase [bacterium]|jgi:6,7-dimethyl-8-ribityllumazine synthase|nr:6,7-dimethyl-8-ribityllumazine synthase [bacterium]